MHSHAAADTREQVEIDGQVNISNLAQAAQPETTVWMICAARTTLATAIARGLLSLLTPSG
jgi:hypothetical protein